MLIGCMPLTLQSKELLESLGFEIYTTVNDEWFLVCFESLRAEGYVGKYFQELNEEDLHALLVLKDDNIRLTYLEGKYGANKDVERFCNWKST